MVDVEAGRDPAVRPPPASPPGQPRPRVRSRHQARAPVHHACGPRTHPTATRQRSPSSPV